MPCDRQEGHGGEHLAHGQAQTGKGKKIAPVFVVEVAHEQETEQQNHGIDGHDDGRDVLYDEVECAVVCTDDKPLLAQALLIHYHTPKSLRPRTTVSARLTTRTVPADF